MTYGIQVGEGDGSRPFKPRKKALPNDYSLSVSPVKSGNDQRRYSPNAPHVGWGVFPPRDSDSRWLHGDPAFSAERLEDALAWAAERYSISGWKRCKNIHYAIPGKAPKE